MKKCCTCQTERNKKDFNKNKAKSDGLNSICRACSQARSRLYYRENRKKHLAVVTRKNKKRRKEVHQFIVEYLQLHPCVDCGEGNPVVLEFDHIKGDKKDAVSSLIQRRCSINTIKSEIDKCEIRCANCHRKKTAVDFNWYKLGS